MVAIEAPTKDDIGCERASIMPMGSLFEETTGLLFDLIIVDLMECMKITNNDMVSHHANLEQALGIGVGLSAKRALNRIRKGNWVVKAS